MTTAQEIIAIFDETLDTIYGRENGRDYPSKDDIVLAEKWIAKGLLPETAKALFTEQLEKMHLKWIDRARSNDRGMVPHGLKILAEDMDLVLMNQDRLVHNHNMRFDQWRARVIGWSKTGIWFDDVFGSKPPNHMDTRVPKTVLVDLAEIIKTAAPIKKLNNKNN